MSTMPPVEHRSENRAALKESILNENLLLQYEAMDDGDSDDPLLASLMEIFEKHIPEHLQCLALATQNDDGAEVKYLLHKMLGMAHNMGASRLAGLIALLEESRSRADISLNESDLSALNEEFETALAALSMRWQDRRH